MKRKLIPTEVSCMFKNDNCQMKCIFTIEILNYVIEYGMMLDHQQAVRKSNRGCGNVDKHKNRSHLMETTNIQMHRSWKCCKRKRKLIKEIKVRQVMYFGHIERHNKVYKDHIKEDNQRKMSKGMIVTREGR